VKVAVLTTSYPRHPTDVVGRFVADGVEHVRRRGVEVEVVGPEQFRGFGLTYGHGVLGNLRRRPWLAFFVPALLASFVRAARRVEADVLHAHWLPAGWVAAQTATPYVVQVWGTDVELA
jgi:Glycosyltransferase Family 4